jgi:phosphatidylinositol alpha-mannosyltransferase
VRVGIVCPYSFDVPGGVQYHVRDLAEHLIARGHDAQVLAPADESTELPDWVTSCGRAAAIRYNGSVARLTFGPVTNARVNKWLAAHDFDLVHLHEPITPSASVIALLNAPDDLPIVATFHTINLRSRAMQAAYPLVRPAMEKIRGRIAVSEDARRTVTTHLGGDAVVIPNGVNTRVFREATPRGPWVGTPEAPTLAFLGRIDEPRKGLPVIAAAMPAVLERHPATRLLVAGPGDVDAARDLLPPVARGATTFLGLVSDADKAALLASVSAYVAPHTGGESFGIVLVEAMAAGAPVVASDLPAFVRVLGETGAGRTFANGDAAALGRTLAEVLGDGPALADMGETGIRRAQDFDWERVVSDILGVYETVTEAVPPSDSRGSRWQRLFRPLEGGAR